MPSFQVTKLHGDKSEVTIDLDHFNGVESLSTSGDVRQIARISFYDPGAKRNKTLLVQESAKEVHMRRLSVSVKDVGSSIGALGGFAAGEISERFEKTRKKIEPAIEPVLQKVKPVADKVGVVLDDIAKTADREYSERVAKDSVQFAEMSALWRNGQKKAQGMFDVALTSSLSVLGDVSNAVGRALRKNAAVVSPKQEEQHAPSNNQGAGPAAP